MSEFDYEGGFDETGYDAGGYEGGGELDFHGTPEFQQAVDERTRAILEDFVARQEQAGNPYYTEPGHGQAQVDAEAFAYFQQMVERALAPFEGVMDQHAQREGEGRIAEILESFASEHGIDLDDSTRVDAWQMADEFIAGCEQDPQLLDVVFEELDAFPELKAAVVADINAQGLAPLGLEAVLHTPSFAEHLLLEAARHLSRPPAKTEMDVVNRYFPAHPRQKLPTDAAPDWMQSVLAKV